MPELPEVEIAREQLTKWLTGRRIVACRARDPLIRRGQSQRRVETALAGARVGEVTRRGKYILLNLGRRRPSVISHLGMSGKFEHFRRDDPLPLHARVVLELTRGERVTLTDTRRLGQFSLVDANAERRLARLGPEPLSERFTSKSLAAITAATDRPIKVALMDQHRIAGIGNIQAAEALFVARIHPETPASTLDQASNRRLRNAIRKSLRKELRRYRNGSGRYLQEGAMNEFLVYGRSGQPCPRCRAEIHRLVQGGRSSYYCPACQPEIPA